MILKYFYDVPVYRVSNEKYAKQRTADIEKVVRDVWENLADNPEEKKRTHDLLEQGHYDKYGCWLFNEIVGYIRLHILGSQIRGEYYSAEKSKTYKTRKKVFKYQTWKLGHEKSLRGDETNAEIVGAIREYLRRCKSELRSDRFIDTEQFDAIAEYVDWQSLLCNRQSGNSHREAAQ